MGEYTIDAHDIWHWHSGQFSYALTPQQRQGILDAIGKLFVEWLIHSKKHKLTFDYDSPWDHSGQTTSSIIGGPEREALLTGTLQAWMDELTGDRIPTYESGYGKYHEDYEDVVSKYIEEALLDIFTAQFTAQFPDSDDDYYDVVSDEWSGAQFEMGYALLEQAKQISAFEAYQTFEQQVRAEKAAQKRQRVIMTGLARRSGSFFEKRVKPEWPEGKIDRPTWKKHQLPEKLKLALSKADAKELLAIQAVGLQTSPVSNTVSREIEKIVTEFLEKTPLTGQELDEEELFIEGQHATNNSLPIEISEIELHNELLMVESEGGPHIERVEMLADDILSIPGLRIVTIVRGDGISMKFDLDNDNRIGYHEKHERIFTGLLLTAFDAGGGVIVRQFLENRRAKNIYGAAIADGKYQWLSADQVKQACCTDAATGMPLPPEDGVTYCAFKR